MSDLELANSYIDGSLDKPTERDFWSSIASNKEIRAIFYMVLIERWMDNSLPYQHKDLAVKLYKLSPDFKKMYDLIQEMHEVDGKLNASKSSEKQIYQK